MNGKWGVRHKVTTWTLGVILLIALSVRFGPGLAQQGVSPPLTESMREAVAVLRMVNKAESTFHETVGRYGDWGQLQNSGILQGIGASQEQRLRDRGASTVPAFLSNLGAPQPLSDYTMSGYVSAEGSRYLYSLRANSTAACPTSFFTDETGVIVKAKPIGCPPGN